MDRPTFRILRPAPQSFGPRGPRLHLRGQGPWPALERRGRDGEVWRADGLYEPIADPPRSQGVDEGQRGASTCTLGSAMRRRGGRRSGRRDPGSRSCTAAAARQESRCAARSWRGPGRRCRTWRPPARSCALRHVGRVGRELFGEPPTEKTGASVARRFSGCRWSGCRCVTSTAVAPATASGSVKTPGSRTTTCPVLDPDAGVAELRDPHGPEPREAAPSAPIVPHLPRITPDEGPPQVAHTTSLEECRWQCIRLCR